MRTILKNASLISGIAGLLGIFLVEYLLSYAVLFTGAPIAFQFFVLLLPILTIGITSVLLRNILLVSGILFPLHCLITWVLVKMPFEFESFVSLFVVSFSLLFIVSGYFYCLQNILDKNISSTMSNRILSILPLATKMTFFSLTTVIVLLLIFPHMRYGLFANPVFHCVAFVFCPILFLFACVFAAAYPKCVHATK